MLTALALTAARAVTGAPQAAAPGADRAAATASQTAAIDRILVMPFENPSHDARLYWLREGSALLLAEDLRAFGATAIGREERVRAFERLGLPPGATLSDATVIKVAELLGASSVVIGSLGVERETLTVRARTIRLDSGRMQSEVVEQSLLPDLFRTFDRMVIRLFPVLLAPLAHTDKSHPPLPAFEDYVKGVIAESAAGQVKFLQTALKEYPEYDAARIALWQVYSGQGEHGRAAAVALEIPEKSAAYRRARFLAALSQIQLQQYEQAFNALRQLAADRPAASVANNLGIVQFRRGVFGQAGGATYYFSEARKLAPSDFDAIFNLGYAYFFEHDLQASIYWLREAVRGNPVDGDAHYVLGTALSATGATTEGAREKDLARHLSSSYAEWDKRPSNDPVPRGLERIKEDIEPTPLARGDLAYQAAGQRDQQDLARFHLEQGRKSFERESDRDAIAELKRAIYLSPYQAEAHLLLGRVYLRNGRLHDAADELKISLWSQETVAGHLALGETYLQMKDPDAARAEAQRALTQDPGSADAKALLQRIGT